MKSFIKITCWSGRKLLVPVTNIQHIEEDKEGSIIIINPTLKKSGSQTNLLFVKETVDEIEKQLGVWGGLWKRNM